MKVTIFKNIKETSTPFIRDIDFILNRIKNGNSKDLINQIRNDKVNREQLKKNLPSICFSGIFKNRSVKGLLEHSGLICLDFDKYSDSNELVTFYNQLKEDEFTYACFISPSGDGIKLLVKIPAEVENHKLYFEALDEYYNNEHFDSSVSDVSRVCFESYDSNIYINKDSSIWNKKIENKIYSYESKAPTIKLTNENEIIKRLFVWFEKNYGLIVNQRNVNVFKFAAALSDFGVSKLEAIRFCNQFASEGFDYKEIETIINSAYKRGAGNFGMKYFEDNETLNFVKKEIKSGKQLDEIKKTIPTIDEDSLKQIKDDATINNFWEITKNGVKINHYDFKLWLQSNGFYKYYPESSESFIFVYISNNLVDNTNEVKIKEFVLNEMLQNSEHQVYQHLADRSKYFREEYLNILDPIDLKFKEDTIETAYIYFQNGAIKVKKNGIDLIDYLDLDGFVWKKHIIDFEITHVEDIECDFKKFIYLVSNKDEQREISLQTTIGYLMHSFKTSANNKAVILNDETISENPNGGSGKGIFWNALSKVKRVADINGKSFSFDKSFPYQTVSADTQILVFDDVHKNFKFENLFSVITEGITLEKKNKDAFKIPVSRSPKILITTNYTIGGVGGSFERRKWELEFSAHFSSKHTPLNEFGKMLFEEWTNEEWMKFYNFMLRCLQLYLTNGLVSYDFQNLEIRKFIKETCFEFYEWTNEGIIKTNESFEKNYLYNTFLEDYPDWRKFNLSQKRFWQWIDKYCEFKKLECKKSYNTMGTRTVEFYETT